MPNRLSVDSRCKTIPQQTIPQWHFSGLFFGVVFFLVAIASTISNVTPNLFNPWLGSQVRHRENLRTFIALVFF